MLKITVELSEIDVEALQMLYTKMWDKIDFLEDAEDADVQDLRDQVAALGRICNAIEGIE